MKIWALAGLLAVSGVVAQPVAAASEAAAKFGARQMIEDVSIAPDGNSIALIQPTMGRGSVLYIVSLNGTPELKPILSSSGSPERLGYCRWSTGTRLICGIYVVEMIAGDPRAYTRLVSLNSDGSDVKPLSARASSNALGVAMSGGKVIDWLGDDKGAVLMTHTYVPEQSTGSLTTSQREGLGVDRVDTTTLVRKMVEAPRPAASEYISDGRGTIRIMGVQPDTNTGMMGNRTVYTYRKKDSREWLPLGTTVYDGVLLRGFNPYAVDPDLDVAYGFDNENGRTALFKISLDGSLKKELVYERPDVDVDRLIQVGRQDRVVGVGYSGEKPMTAFFDPALKAIAASLSKALPGSRW